MHISSILLFVLLIGAVLVDARVASKVKTVPRHQNHRDHTVDLLPNIADHAVMKKLRCSSCLQLSKQLWNKFQTVYSTASTTPKQALKVGYGGGVKAPIHAELVRVIDSMCLELNNVYGLVVRDGETTTEVSDDKTLELLQGIWLNDFMKKRCAQLMVHHEDRIVEKHPEADTIDHFSKMMCMEWDGSCEAADLVKKGLKVSASQSIRAEDL